MEPCPPGWELSVRLTTSPRKKLPVRKPAPGYSNKRKTYKSMDELCIVGQKKNAKLGTGRRSQRVEGYGGGPLWRPIMEAKAHIELQCQ